MLLKQSRIKRESLLQLRFMKQQTLSTIIERNALKVAPCGARACLLSYFPHAFFAQHHHGFYFCHRWQ